MGQGLGLRGTTGGGGVRYMSQNRLAVPIVALCDDPETLRRMALMFGVRPVYCQPPVDNRLILETLRNCDGNRTKAASVLGIGVRTLYDRLRRLEAST